MLEAFDQPLGELLLQRWIALVSSLVAKGAKLRPGTTSVGTCTMYVPSWVIGRKVYCGFREASLGHQN